jgi:hypothetical protein
MTLHKRLNGEVERVSLLHLALRAPRMAVLSNCQNRARTRRLLVAKQEDAEALVLRLFKQLQRVVCSLQT